MLRLAQSSLFCVIVSGGAPVPGSIRAMADATHTPLFCSPLSSLEVLWLLRPYLGRALAPSSSRHGVLLDVLGLGVMITGESGVGKSELALELISRGHGLVADDVVELYRIAPETLGRPVSAHAARFSRSARPRNAEYSHDFRRDRSAPEKKYEAHRPPAKT